MLHTDFSDNNKAILNMTKRFLQAAAVILATVSASAWASGNHAGGHDKDSIGKPGVATKVTRTMTVDMNDGMRFTPERIRIEKGETVRFVVRNSGKLKHEMVLGTEQEILEHHELMKRFPGMEHEDPQMVSVAPGEKGQLVWTFTKPGVVHFACLQPGHFEAGMKGSVEVTTTSASKKEGNPS